MTNSVLLHQLLVNAAAQKPDKIAARCGNVSISYGELDYLSNKLAYSLIHTGVCPLDRVCIYLDKSIESLVAIFGVLKAGAIYVPLDTGMPLNRVTTIMSDCKPRAVISVSSKINPLYAQLMPQCRVVLIDQGREFIERENERKSITWDDVLACLPHYPSQNTIESDPAYILYTSGSTGTPKGVVISHRAAMVFIDWTYHEFKILSKDVVANHAPLHFDLSIFDIYTTIKAGATIVLIPPTVSLFPSNLVSLIVKEKITVWYSVPSMLIKMILYGKMEERDFSNLRLVLFAGEVFPVKYLKKLVELIPGATYYNLFGPTETNVCTYFKVNPDRLDDTIPIGKACPYNKLFLLNNDELNYVEHTNDKTLIDDAASFLEIADGELCVQGSNVMHHYWCNPEGTDARKKEVLIHNDLGKETIYCTGDWVKQYANGDIHYIGRMDGMIKSRGYRIELDEIERVLHQHPRVYRAAVIPVPDLESTNLIYAFISQNESRGDDDVMLDAKEIKSFCSTYLPRYMIPAVVEFYDELPETMNGKIDKIKLKEKIRRES